jgi:hypothetical protein
MDELEALASSWTSASAADMLNSSQGPDMEGLEPIEDSGDEEER